VEQHRKAQKPTKQQRKQIEKQNRAKEAQGCRAFTINKRKGQQLVAIKRGKRREKFRRRADPQTKEGWTKQAGHKKL